MKKYLFIILLTALVHPVVHAETTMNDFETELRFLEGKEIAQELKAEGLVEKMSAQNNPERENDLLEDSVNTQKSAEIRKTPVPELAPIAEEAKIQKKSRRVPSR